MKRGVVDGKKSQEARDGQFAGDGMGKGGEGGQEEVCE